MTNKRITELTALDGDDVADNDVIPIVDISDTTMAASGTTKKITVAELITDSAINNRFVQSSVLTTNDDILTRAAGVPARITRANLAADAAFTSQFVPTSEDQVFLSPGSMVAILGAALTAQGNGPTAIALDASATEAAEGQVWLPNYWNTYHLDMWWTNAGAGAGNVHFTVYVGHTADGGSLNNPSVFSQAVTAPVSNTVEVTRVQTSATQTNNTLTSASVLRTGGNAGDTLGNDCFFLGFVFTRAS
jgi:hypothetical protein